MKIEGRAMVLSGRRKQAQVNDGLILQAARKVFLIDSAAPVSAVATTAGVGISALYRRYTSKEDLLRTLCHDGLKLMNEIAEEALQVRDPRDAFEEFLKKVVDADVHALTVHLGGTFEPTKEMHADAQRSGELVSELFTRAQSSGHIRSDAVLGDIELILESCSAIRTPDAVRSGELRQRHLALMLDGLTRKESKLPGPAPTNEMGWRWRKS